MELYNKKDNPDLGNNEADLHNEGVDLVGSGVREENEFTGDEASPSSPEAIPMPPPSETVKEPEPVKEPAPSVGLVPPMAHMVPPTPPPPAPKPEIPKTEVTKPQPIPADNSKNDPSIKPLRTFKSDAEEAVRYQNVSAVDIALAEQKKRESTPIQYVEEKKSGGALIAIIAIVILALLGGAAYYWLTFGETVDSGIPEAASVQTLIPYATGSTLAMKEEGNLEAIGSKLASADQGLGDVYALVPTMFATSTSPADVRTVFSGTSMPSRLSRSLAAEYMIGSYYFEENDPFIILKTTFFQNAFAGMLEWEKNMREDLLPLIKVSNPDESVIVQSGEAFEDAVISNIDARVLKNSGGNTVLAYAFADTETIVVTTSETALKYVLDRLLSVRSVQ